jgi:hypothetical protein
MMIYTQPGNWPRCSPDGHNLGEKWFDGSIANHRSVVSQFVENVSSEEIFDERLAALLHSR